MKQKKGFDHLIGDENNQLSEPEIEMYQRILKAHSNEQSIEEKRSYKHINLKLEMEDYIDSNSSEVKSAGHFLERLLSIYDVKKSQFASFIGMEKTNFYALLKGRRKFNNVVATKVGKTFNIDPQIWMFIEVKNELHEHKLISEVNDKEFSISNLLNFN